MTCAHINQTRALKVDVTGGSMHHRAGGSVQGDSSSDDQPSEEEEEEEDSYDEGWAGSGIARQQP